MGTKLSIPKANFFNDRVQIPLQLLLKAGGSYTSPQGQTYYAGSKDTWLEFDDILIASTGPDIKKAVLDITASYNINNTFHNFTSLELVVINGKVTSMMQSFGGCTTLKMVDFSNASADDIVNIAFTFYNCDNLENINMSGLHSSAATELYNTFTNCKKAKNIIIPDFNNVLTSCYQAFYNCNSCEHIDVSGIDFTGITEASDGKISTTFGGTPALKTIKCKDSANAAWIQEVYDLAYAGGVAYSYDSSTHILTITRT